MFRTRTSSGAVVTHRLHPAPDHASVIDADTQVLDVRGPGEFAGGSISGARNIPLDALAGHLDELDRSRRVVVLCQSGRRSQQAAELLGRAGFTDVVDLAGGMSAVAASAD